MGSAGAERALGTALTGLGRYAEAEALLLESYQSVRSQTGAGSADSRRSRERLVTLYTAWGEPALAAEYLDPPE